MAAAKSLTLQCMQLGDLDEVFSDAASQHSSGSGSSGSGSRSGPGSAAPSIPEAVHEAITSPLRDAAAPFDEGPPQFEAPEFAQAHVSPAPSPLPAQPSPIKLLSPLRQSPLPAGPKQPVQRRAAKQQAVVALPSSPVAAPSPSKPAYPATPETDDSTDNTDRNKQLMTYLLLPSLAFLGTYFAAPLIAPGLFENKITKEQDTKKALLAAALAACATVLTARCVL